MATGSSDSGHLGPIPLRGRKRAVMRTLGRAQRRSGRCLAAAEGNDHGGKLSLWEEFTGGREVRQRERGRKGGRRGVQQRLQEVSSVARAVSRRWHCELGRSATQLPEEVDKGGFFTKPPGLWGFPEKTKQNKFCIIQCFAFV
jgi:hypothetical protein